VRENVQLGQPQRNRQVGDLERTFCQFSLGKTALKRLQGEMMQNKGFETTAQAAQRKIQERWLREKVTRRELIETVNRVAAFVDFIYEQSPELRAALDERMKAQQAPPPEQHSGYVETIEQPAAEAEQPTYRSVP
jgi:hypothetical protein